MLQPPLARFVCRETHWWGTSENLTFAVLGALLFVLLSTHALLVRVLDVDAPQPFLDEQTVLLCLLLPLGYHRAGRTQLDLLMISEAEHWPCDKDHVIECCCRIKALTSTKTLEKHEAPHLVGTSADSMARSGTGLLRTVANPEREQSRTNKAVLLNNPFGGEVI